jgi:NADPH-dependent F420 reductase
MSLIAILGGTGKEGQGLALRFASRGRPVILGSREREKGARVAEELNAKLGSRLVSGAENLDAAHKGSVVVSTLPYSGHTETVKELAPALTGKLLLTATIRWPPALDGAPSAAEDLAKVVDRSTRVAAAFQTVSAHSLRNLEGEPEDVLVFADSADTRLEAIELVNETGLRGIDAGPLEKARIAEALTGLLLGVNKRYGVKSTGIRITGLLSRGPLGPGP